MLLDPAFGSNPIGYLDLAVVGAADLIALDGPLLIVGGEASSDPFATIFLDDKDQQQQTHTIRRDLHPKWDYTTTLVVKNAASILQIDVNDLDQAILHGKDVSKPLGTLSIPLSTLPINQTIECWFALQPPKNGVTLEYQSDQQQEAPWGRIMLRLHYETTRQALFYAGFLPPPPIIEQPPEPFSADHAYQNLMRCLEYLWPMLDVVTGLLNIQSWTNPLKSILFLFGWYYLCRHPHWIPIFIHASLIFKMSIEYVRLHIQEHAHGASEVDKLRKTVTYIKQKNGDTEDEASLGSFLDKVATFLVGRGLAGTLQTTQNTLGSVAGGLDILTGLVKWKDQSASKTMFIGLFMSAFLFATVPFHYWLVCCTIWIMTSKTHPYALFVYTVSGLAKIRSLSPPYDGIKTRLPSLMRVRKVNLKKSKTKRL